MRAHVLALAGIVLACATATVGAQTESKPSSSQAAPTPETTPTPHATPTRKPVKAISLKGCLQDNTPGTDVYTLVDSKGGTTYRVSGADVRPHVGHRVQIVGGLIPSPNVAAQAGALDPVKAAIAGTGPNAAGPGNVNLELRVTRVQRLTGACGQP